MKRPVYQRHPRMVIHPSGEPTVSQYTWEGIEVTYNPDDRRFYIVDTRLPGEPTISRQSLWRNIPGIIKRYLAS